MFMAASTRDREVVLQPILPSQMTLSSSSVTSEYLEAVTRDTAQLALNRSPETLQYWMDGLVAISAPDTRGALKADLMRIMDEQQGSQITQFVTIDWIKTDPEALTSQVGGVLHTIVGSRDVRREHKIFEFHWKYTGVSLRLKGFGVVVKEGEEE
jgi:conjugal transfer pilus assembly protein TraE